MTTAYRLRLAMTIALGCLLVGLWATTHRYTGLAYDARVYAFQALSRLHPALRADLYLQNTSQDQFTVFSPFYAFFIRSLGLESAALVLTIIFTTWLMAAAWTIARRVGSYEFAWASVASIIIITGNYGAFHVFYFPETYLSARLPAYALIATAISLHLWDQKKLALCLGAAALAVHPLMAFPGILLLLALRLSTAGVLIVAAVGVALALVMAGAAVELPRVQQFVTIIDPNWLEVVKERSAFLFLQLWSLQDFEFNARPFLSLAVTATVMTQGQHRDLCLRSLLIGATGLLVAYIGGRIGPVAVLVQGQAWRWEWITCFIAILLLPQTFSRLWSYERSGPLCSILIACAWTFPVIDGSICAGLVLVLRLINNRLTSTTAKHLRWAAIALGCVVAAWAIGTSWNITISVAPESGREYAALTKMRNILGLGVSACGGFGILWYWTITRRSIRGPLILTAGLMAGLAYLLPRSFQQLENPDPSASFAEFADWRAAIPPTSAVFVAPAQDAGRFVWFWLQRPHYLSPDQSAGVVFSRNTALEVKRRSEVLLPIETPNWKFMSARMQSAGRSPDKAPPKPITEQNLTSVCRDPLLGFVVAKNIEGILPVRRMDHGKWKAWNLYDCGSVRAQDSAK